MQIAIIFRHSATVRNVNIWPSNNYLRSSIWSVELIEVQEEVSLFVLLYLNLLMKHNNASSSNWLLRRAQPWAYWKRELFPGRVESLPCAWGRYRMILCKRKRAFLSCLLSKRGNFLRMKICRIHLCGWAKEDNKYHKVLCYSLCRFFSPSSRSTQRTVNLSSGAVSGEFACTAV